MWVLQDENDRLGQVTEENEERIKDLQEKNICLNAKIKELDEALGRLTVFSLIGTKGTEESHT